MPSKNIALILMVLLLSSCTDFLRGPKHEPESLEIPTGPLACLQKLPENFSKIGKGHAEAAEVDADFKCLEAGLLYFKNRTVGTYHDSYTAEDFRRFFGKYFLGEKNISKNFADHLVLLKSAVIGGQEDIVTKEEVGKLAHFIGVLGKELIPLLPSLEILLQKAEKADQKQIDVAIAAVKKAEQALLKESLIYKSSYTFEDLHGLAVETAAFVGIQRSRQASVDFKKYWPLVESFKKVILGEQASLPTIYDWMGALNSFVDLYDLSLRNHYLLQDIDLKKSDDLNKVGDFIEKFLTLLKNSHQLKIYNFIPCSQVDELIDRLYQAEIISPGLSSSTLKETYRTVLGRMTLGTHFRFANDVTTITQDHIESLIREVHIWRSLQTWINTLTHNANQALPWTEVTSSYDDYLNMDLVKGLLLFQQSSVSTLQQAETVAALKEFKTLLNRERPLKFSPEGRFILEYSTKAGGVTWTSLSLSNMTYMFSRLMLRGYGEFSPTTQKVIISEHEFVRWYDDFKNIGLELKAFDPRQANAGKRSSKEANFFMLSSNGDNEVDANELYEYIGMLVGAGLRSIDAVRQVAVLENCLETGTKDVFGFPYLKANEFKLAVAKHRAELFSNLPFLVSYFKRFPDRWSPFYDKLLDAARFSDPKLGRVEHGDLRVFVMMIHYQESLLLAFDSNHDGMLSVQETEMAVPRFLSFLREITTDIPWFLKSVDGWVLKHGFIYLVMQGHRPVGPDWFQYLWLRMTDPLSGGEAHVDRVGVAQVFRNLKDELKKP